MSRINYVHHTFVDVKEFDAESVGIALRNVHDVINVSVDVEVFVGSANQAAIRLDGTVTTFL